MSSRIWLLRPSPGGVVVLIASGILSLVAGDIQVGGCLMGVWAVWAILADVPGPPVLALALSHQWFQVSVGVLYTAVLGRPLKVMLYSDYKPVVWLGLSAVLSLAIGLRLALHRLLPRRSGGFAFSPSGVTIFYIVFTVMLSAIQQLAWEISGLTQAILTLTLVRLILVFLMLRRCMQPTFRPGWFLLLLTWELWFGATSFFATFREPLMIAFLVLLEAFDRKRSAHWLLAACMVVLTVGSGMFWTQVKGEFRREAFHGDVEESRTDRLARISDLAQGWVGGNQDQLQGQADRLVDRLWQVFFPALALKRVPSYLPHENGAILGNAFSHVLRPRLFFPDKELLPSDSEAVMKYTGFFVAGERDNTSFAFGYMIESYIDFGIPLMFLPIVLLGAFLGLCYRFLWVRITQNEVAVGVITVIFWINLYLYERSWLKTLGTVGRTVLLIGGAALIVDRIVARYAVAEEEEPAPVSEAPDPEVAESI